MVTIAPLTSTDRTPWEALFRKYIEFYGRAEPDELYDAKWHDLLADTRIHALGARLDGELVGITHFFIHPNTSGPDQCYLQDLFTAPEARGKGAARALIAAVGDWARERGCTRLYWHTHESNHTARALYDQVAQHRGFLKYDVDL